MRYEIFNSNDYYEVWDRHIAKTLVEQLGLYAAIKKCSENNWHHLAGILRTDFIDGN